MTRLLFFTGIFCFSFLSLLSQTLSRKSSLDELSLAFAKNSWNAFYDFLALPNDAHFAADMEKTSNGAKPLFRNAVFKYNAFLRPNSRSCWQPGNNPEQPKLSWCTYK